MDHKRSKLQTLGSPFILLALIVVSCSLALAEERTIRIGVIAPLSGPAAELGTELKNGIEIAHSSLNASLEVVYEDGACDPKTAVSAARKLVTIDKVTAVIGPLCSPSFIATSPVFEKAGIVHIHASSGTPNTYRHRGKFGIEGTGTVMQENKYLAEHIYSQGHRRLALIHPEQEWASGHASAFTHEFEKLGGEVVASESFSDLGLSDFRSILFRLKQSRPDALYLPAFNQHISVILKQLPQAGIRLPVFSQYDVENDAVIEVAGSRADGLVYTYPFDNSNLKGPALLFSQKYERRYLRKPSFYPYNGYDLFRLVDSAVSQCETNSKCIYQEITSKQNFESLTGKLSFIDGSVSRTFIIKTVRDGEFVPWKK